MVIKIVSDLHFEFGAGSTLQRITKNLPDILIVAGDTHQLNKDFFKILQSFVDKGIKNVVTILGNHEFNNISITEGHKIVEFTQHLYPNIYVLTSNKPSVEIEGIQYVGVTGWFPKSPYTDILISEFRNNYGPEPLDLNEVDYYHKKDKASLQQLLSISHPKRIVITHLIPSYGLVPTKFRDDVGNCYFVTELSDLIDHSDFDYWVFGHTHEGYQGMFLDKQFICNPKGYNNENKNFDPDLAVVL